ncbi:hypothetical protein [Parvicella tangerina]|nr:hypothetical protein [Parvicella tangerina]
MKTPIIITTFLAFSTFSFAQNVGINATGAIPDNSAMLDVQSTDKGMLIPRMTTAQRTAIGTPATGLEVYDTSTGTFWYYNGTVWVEEAIGDDDWTVSGVDMYSAVTGDVGIGTNNPTAKLTVQGVSGDENTNGMLRLLGPAGNANLRLGVVDGSRSWIQSHGALPLYLNTLGNDLILNANAGEVGIGITNPTQKLDVQGGNARINNAFVGDVGHGANWAGFSHQNQASTTGYSFLSGINGDYTLINKANTGAGYIGFRQGNVDMAVIDYNGNMGIGTTTPPSYARLQTVGGSIMPEVGNSNASGIYFPSNPGGGAGDEAYIRYYAESGENTKLVIANQNDPDDDLDLQTGGQSRINIDGDGSVRIDEGVLFDCDDCGDVATIDGASNWGDLVIQGRVLSTNSNLHLSPPGGYRVIINSTYRSAGGATGTTGLDIQDGGIRMRKNYYYFQRYEYCNCYGAGAATHTIGSYDFCSVSHFGFKNNQSATDEDDDVQCAVYPSGHGGSGEQTDYSTSFTYQYNARPTWIMYLEAYQDTNGVTCGAICINFD